MDEDCDFASILKQLDALDERHYTPQRNKLVTKKSNKMSLHLDTPSNASDFDNSDEDLASLLADDEEGILTKKPFGNSPSKDKTSNIKIPEKSSVNPAVSSSSGTERLGKDLAENSQSDRKSSTFVTSPIHELSKSKSREKEDLGSDALDDILSDATLSSFPKKQTLSVNREAKGETISTESKQSEDNKPARKSKDSFFDTFFKNLESPKGSPENSIAAGSKEIKSDFSKVKDDDILNSDEKGSSQKRKDSYFDSFLKSISPKNSPKKTPIESDKRRQSTISLKDDSDIDDDDDLLKSLNSDEEASPLKRRDSFLDTFLKKTSPVTTPKKSLLKIEDKKKSDTKKKELEDSDDDIFGKSALDTKKTSGEQKHSNPDKRKTLLKQVSFKGLPASSPENSPIKENTQLSPNRQPESEAKTKPTTQPRRSERMGASNKDDTDWLNFFKESPKKTPRSQIPAKDVERPSTAVDFRSRRKSSSAEWLGLSESDIAARDSGSVIKGNLSKESEFENSGSVEPVKVVRPRTTPESSGRRKVQVKSDLSWLGNNERNSLEIATDSTVGKGSMNVLGKEMSAKGGGGDLEDFKEVFAPATGLPTTAERDVNVQRSPFTLNSDLATHEVPIMIKSCSDDPEVRAMAVYESGQSFNEPSGSSVSLQVINNHILERDQLIKSSEVMKKMYEERIETIENLHKNQLKSSEESIKVLETRLKSEMDCQVHSTEEKLTLLQSEKKQLEKDSKEKLEHLERQNAKEIERLKDLHNQSIALMKQDHEEALRRLTRLKEQEIEAILSTQTHSKSLQHLSEQLEARASELASLQSKVEERNQVTLKEKQALLETKEKDLKNLQSRVERQLEDGDAERSRLQQLVLRLESRLQKYTMEGEEDRWEVQQMKARLSVQQKHLEEEYKLQTQQVEREKEKLRLAQDSLLQEQKTVLVQLAQERQQLMREKMDMEAVAKKLKEEESILHVKKMKEESYIESQKQFIQQEENRLRFEKSSVKQEAELLERERDSLQRERQLLNEEKLKMNEFSFKVKRKETEVEMMAMSATEDKERAQIEHASTLRIKVEQQSRMQQIAQKLQEVMEKEQQILSDKEKLSEERLDLENKKKSILCNKCKLSLGLPVNAPPLNIEPVALSAPIANLPLSNGYSNHLETFRHDPSLVVWYITAQRDREYLQEELAFLRNLKDSSKMRRQ